MLRKAMPSNRKERALRGTRYQVCVFFISFTKPVPRNRPQRLFCWNLSLRQVCESYFGLASAGVPVSATFIRSYRLRHHICQIVSFTTLLRSSCVRRHHLLRPYEYQVVRWATGKWLADRLPKLSLATIHDSGYPSYFRT